MENIVLYVDVGKLEPNELPATQRIQAHVTGVVGASSVVIKLGTTTCSVKVSERTPT